MQTDLVKELGYTALATRLKRISDTMTHSTRLLYKTLDIEMEPNWYLVLVLVKETPEISVMQIAKSIGFTHQSVLGMTNKMVNYGYLNVTKDQNDKRKTVFTITNKGLEILPEIEEVWKTGKTVIYELLNMDTTIMQHLEILENNLSKASFSDRILNKLP